VSVASPLAVVDPLRSHAPSPSPSPSAPPRAAQSGTSIVGPMWDLVLFGPGATLAVSALLLALACAGQEAGASALGNMLALLLLGPHYAATYRRAYVSRDIVRAHPLVTLAAPVLLALAAAAAVRWPARVGVAYFAGYVVWSGYHYSGQSLGVAMLFPLRQGARLDPREKRLLSLPLYVSWLLSLLGLLRLDGSARNPAYELVRASLGGLRLPAWVVGAAVAALLASFAGVAVVARARRRRGVPLPAATYGALAAQVIWFGAGLFFPFFNIVLVPIFHSLQYLALTSWHHCRGRAAGATSRRFAAYAVTVALLGLGINPGLLSVLAPAGPPEHALVVAAAAISAINLHHFLLDGRIWRLRERPVVQSMTA
jgi:hypothetical protein